MDKVESEEYCRVNVSGAEFGVQNFCNLEAVFDFIEADDGGKASAYPKQSSRLWGLYVTRTRRRTAWIVNLGSYCDSSCRAGIVWGIIWHSRRELTNPAQLARIVSA